MAFSPLTRSNTTLPSTRPSLFSKKLWLAKHGSCRHPKDSGLGVIKGVPSAAAEELSWPRLERVEILLNNHSEVGPDCGPGQVRSPPFPAACYGIWALGCRSLGSRKEEASFRRSVAMPVNLTLFSSAHQEAWI